MAQFGWPFIISLHWIEKKVDQRQALLEDEKDYPHSHFSLNISHWNLRPVLHVLIGREPTHWTFHVFINPNSESGEWGGGTNVYIAACQSSLRYGFGELILKFLVLLVINQIKSETPYYAWKRINVIVRFPSWKCKINSGNREWIIHENTCTHTQKK